MKKTKSAGGVVVNQFGKVLVTNQHGDSWSLPKGHVEEGESPRQAAAREIEEETGVQQLEFVEELGTYSRARIGKGGVGEVPSEQKSITMFLYTTRQKSLKPTDPENPEARWVAQKHVPELLTHPKDKEFFENVQHKVTAITPKTWTHSRTSKVIGFVLIFLLIGIIVTTVRSSQNTSRPLINIKVEQTDDPLVVAAGDIACDPKSPSFNTTLGDATNCHMNQTAKITTKINPDSVFLLGDNQYEKGEYGNYMASFDPTWGVFKGLVRPVPGNHEYYTPGASGYFQYFGASAHQDTSGYYSFDLGKWHIIALNSNCAMVGGCNEGSPQYKWLVEDLTAHPSTCTLAFWHHPRFSSGDHGDDPITQDFWKILYQNKVDVILNGHDHLYERFAPQNPQAQSDPQGITQFTVGTGGKNLTKVKDVRPNSLVRSDNQYGVLRLMLHDTSYNWKFLPENNTPIDQGAQVCHE